MELTYLILTMVSTVLILIGQKRISRITGELPRSGSVLVASGLLLIALVVPLVGIMIKPTIPIVVVGGLFFAVYSFVACQTLIRLGLRSD